MVQEAQIGGGKRPLPGESRIHPTREPLSVPYSSYLPFGLGRWCLLRAIQQRRSGLLHRHGDQERGGGDGHPGDEIKAHDLLFGLGVIPTAVVDPQPGGVDFGKGVRPFPRHLGKVSVGAERPVGERKGLTEVS